MRQADGTTADRGLSDDENAEAYLRAALWSLERASEERRRQSTDTAAYRTLALDRTMAALAYLAQIDGTSWQEATSRLIARMRALRRLDASRAEAVPEAAGASVLG